MTRPLRIEYEGAWYHVMNRGANRQNIFTKDAHRNIFLSLLKEGKEKFHVEIHAYCLMENHYHLLIRTLLPNLSKLMQHLDGVYTQRLNMLEKRDGALFRGRYKSILVEAESYLLQVSRYIHLNPVSAKICQFPQQYKWSSYPCFYYDQEPYHQPWLQTNFILGLMGGSNLRNSYRKFVEDGIDDETNNFYAKKHISSIMGKKQFIEKNLSTIKDKIKEDCITDINCTISLPTTDMIIGTVCDYFKISHENLKKPSQGKRNPAKMIVIYLLQQMANATHQTIADNFINLNRRSISKIVSRCKFLVQHEDIFKKYIDELTELVKLKLV
jgi:REP element-mobilizing transposase RayT